VASFALKRFNVGDKVLYAHAAQVLIGLNLMKDRAPDRHLMGAVCGRSLRTFEYVADAVAGKLPSGVLGEQGEVGHFGVESGGRRTVSLPVESVAGCAVGAENGMGIHALDGRVFLFLGRAMRREKRNCCQLGGDTKRKTKEREKVTTVFHADMVLRNGGVLD
jgi:hypothetical protein